MKIVYISEKGSGDINEDNLIIRDNLFGVFDGAGSIDKHRDEKGHTGGFLAAHIAKETFENNNKSLVDLVWEANSRIREEMIKRGIDTTEKVHLWITTAAIVRIAKNSFDWVQVSDSLILIIYNDDSYNLLTKDYDHDKETLIMWKRLADKKTKNIRRLLNEQITKIRNQANISYGVLNGEEGMANFLSKGTESLKKVKHILLFTDGLFIPQKDPKDKDRFDIFVKLFLEGGLNRIKDYVREKERKDPECWKYPRLKQHDDITAISISF